jgi:hypothetical protein
LKTPKNRKELFGVFLYDFSTSHKLKHLRNSTYFNLEVCNWLKNLPFDYLFSKNMRQIFSSYFFALLIIFCLSSKTIAQDCNGTSTLPDRPWYTGISSRMQESMHLTIEDQVHTDFHGIWMHSGWKNNFGPCTQNYPWSEPKYFQEVIDSGKIPVVFWWWHFDNPQSISLRQEAEQQLRDCLIPFLNEIDRPDSEVWVVLQPEYN